MHALVPASRHIARLAGPRLMEPKASMLQRHLDRVAEWTDTAPAAAADGFGSYGRYWAETFRLPTLDETSIDRGFSFTGFDKIQEVRAQGHGPLIVLPHLGGWEWAAAWLARVADVPVTAVVERLEPDDVFEWFVELRSSYGVHVVPLGSQAFVEVTRAVKRRDVVCLLSDRDISGTGRSVRFFGEETALPIGPVVLSRRTGSPLLPTAVFFDGRRRHCVLDDPIYPKGRSASEMLDAMTAGLERLIAQAPEQWHLLEPNWPSDHA